MAKQVGQPTNKLIRCLIFDEICVGNGERRRWRCRMRIYSASRSSRVTLLGLSFCVSFLITWVSLIWIALCRICNNGVMVSSEFEERALWRETLIVTSLRYLIKCMRDSKSLPPQWYLRITITRRFVKSSEVDYGYQRTILLYNLPLPLTYLSGLSC